MNRRAAPPAGVPDALPSLPREEALLLTAILGDPPAAGSAWAEYRRHLDIRALDGPFYPLLVNAYWNLRQTDRLGPDAALLKGQARHAWSRNQLAARRLDRALAALDEAGVEALLLDAGALALAYYKHPGLRPFPDPTLLVRPLEAVSALGRLVGLGYQPTGPSRAPALLLRRAAPLRAPDGAGLLLRWATGSRIRLPWRAGPEWDDILEVELRGRRLRVLGPTCQLLRALPDAANAEGGHRLQALVDGATILRSAGNTIDWPRLLREAGRLPRPRQTRATLSWLVVQAGVSLPTAALAADRAS